MKLNNKNNNVPSYEQIGVFVHWMEHIQHIQYTWYVAWQCQRSAMTIFTET